MVYSMPSKWLMQKYPPLAKTDGRPDPAAYHRIFDSFYRGAFDAARQVRICHARRLTEVSPDVAVRRHPVLIAAGLYLADDPTLHWLVGLTVVDAEVLAEYDHPHFGRWPTATTRRHEAGRITCVGTVPGRSLARALAVWLATEPVSGWRELPTSVTVMTGSGTDGRRVHIVHNWSWQATRAQAPTSLTDVLDGSWVPSGASVRLGPWDVKAQCG
jgi:beta-galactosidase